MASRAARKRFDERELRRAGDWGAAWAIADTVLGAPDYRERLPDDAVRPLLRILLAQAAVEGMNFERYETGLVDIPGLSNADSPPG